MTEVFLKHLWQEKHAGHSNYTQVVFATAWSCSWGIFRGQRKKYHIQIHLLIWTRINVRWGMLTGHSRVKCILLDLPPLRHHRNKLSKQWGISAIINFIYTLAVSQSSLRLWCFFNLLTNMLAEVSSVAITSVFRGCALVTSYQR